MELLLSVTDTAGRLTGTAWRRGDGTPEPPVAFSGALELLACIERLCQDEHGRATSTKRDG